MNINNVKSGQVVKDKKGAYGVVKTCVHGADYYAYIGVESDLATARHYNEVDGDAVEVSDFWTHALGCCR